MPQIFTTTGGNWWQKTVAIWVLPSFAITFHQISLLATVFHFSWHSMAFGGKSMESMALLQKGIMTQVTEWKSLLIYFVSFICENTQKVWHKNLWNWHGNQNLMIFDLVQRSQVWPEACILFCSSSKSNWYATWPCLKKINFWPLGTPSAPSLGHDPGDRM